VQVYHDFTLINTKAPHHFFFTNQAESAAETHLGGGTAGGKATNKAAVEKVSGSGGGGDRPRILWRTILLQEGAATQQLVARSGREPAT